MAPDPESWLWVQLSSLGRGFGPLSSADLSARYMTEVGTLVSATSKTRGNGMVAGAFPGNLEGCVCREAPAGRDQPLLSQCDPLSLLILLTGTFVLDPDFSPNGLRGLGGVKLTVCSRPDGL